MSNEAPPDGTLSRVGFEATVSPNHAKLKSRAMRT